MIVSKFLLLFNTIIAIIFIIDVKNLGQSVFLKLIPEFFRLYRGCGFIHDEDVPFFNRPGQRYASQKLEPSSFRRSFHPGRANLFVGIIQSEVLW